jgi:16S rRNA (cytosine1402-N4)-methyltransferase
MPLQSQGHGTASFLMKPDSEGSVPRHRAVMPEAVLTYLAIEPGQTIVDATVGAGGHLRLLAQALGERGRLIALDRDPKMLDLAERVMRESGLAKVPIVYIHADFDNLREILDEQQVASVDAILADLGICSDQLDSAERGLSFQMDGPLDMRLDQTQGRTAAQIINSASERELSDILWKYGEERFSRRIARQIVAQRHRSRFRTTKELADLVRGAVPRSGRHRIDPATRTFQAFRIAVNDELGALERFLSQLGDCLRPGGRAGIIGFHSLEDRLVKREFRRRDRWHVLTPKPLSADALEVQSNPRARSAKLRAARRRSHDEQEKSHDP